MAIATRWIGVGSIALVAAVGAMLAGSHRPQSPPPPPHATSNADPVFELGRCVGGRSTFATESRRDFDECLVDHMRDVLAMRHEGPRMIVTASMYSDLAICASHSTCSLGRTAIDQTRPWTVWTFYGQAAQPMGSMAVGCAMFEQGGVRVTSGRDQVSIETEPSTGVEGCVRQFIIIEHHNDQHRIDR